MSIKAESINSKSEGSVEKVLEDAKGMANSLSLRISNWWNALLPVNQDISPTPKNNNLSQTDIEIKSLEALRNSWYSSKEKKRLSNTSIASNGTSSQSNEGEYATIWLLGKDYKILAQDLVNGNFDAFQPLLEDFQAQPWFTYRHHFQTLLPSTYTTDSGWGCMLRSGQCLLGQTFFRRELGRDWRLKDNKDEKVGIKYKKILSWFLDEMSINSPYSIHRIALLGKQYKKEIGDWFGPHTMALVIKSLVLDHEDIDLNVYINTEGTIYKSEILSPNLASSAYEGMSNSFNDKSITAEAGFTPTLILLPIRLGVETLNSIYHVALKSYFGFPQIVGIAGGKPKSSLYFMGFEDDNIIYSDPHHSRPALASKNIDEYNYEDFLSYHCELPNKINIAQLDPCMLLGFYCDNQKEFLDFCQRSEELAKYTTPIFRVCDQKPVYLDDFNMEPDSDDDQF
ncbi:hypothetical protein K502DRAFT_323397 [Neoconidiobolus thromboides FSU 785]|nr:hypothetical protein K502DRAFT_323397 [Neoconidiobolus thromboides FSU 785]